MSLSLSNSMSFVQISFVKVRKIRRKKYTFDTKLDLDKHQQQFFCIFFLLPFLIFFSFVPFLESSHIVEAQGIISIYTGGVMNGFAKRAIFQPFRDHFHIVKLVQHKCQNQLVISNIKHLEPQSLLFLGVTYIHICARNSLNIHFHPKVTRSKGLGSCSGEAQPASSDNIDGGAVVWITDSSFLPRILAPLRFVALVHHS